MNQTLIGKFLADERKKKGYTQKQLADMLMVSDKTISKWETGKSLPDLEMMNMLCQTLDISINELLLGERISNGELKSRSEENVKNLLLENECNRKNNYRNKILGLTVLVLCMFLFGTSLLGMDFTKIVWYIDFPSIIAVVGILTALKLFSQNIKAEICFVEQCIFPVGVIVSILNMVVMLNSTADNYLLKNVAVCILPIFYSAIIYITLKCLKNLKKRR